jgi:hypothetical protein
MSTHARGWSWALAALVGCGSSGSTFPTARFADAPAVKVVNDRRDVPTPPKDRPLFLHVESYDAAIGRRVARAYDIPRDRRALGVNAVDEVPDSTWFTNRIGVRPVTADEIRTGPVTLENPELHTPWTVVSTGFGGSEFAVIVTDSRNVKYLIKFDAREYPEMETGTAVVVNRLLWAAGYNVPEDQVAFVRPEDLVLDRDAVVKDLFGRPKHALTRSELDGHLANVAHERDGRLRVLASRWIDGKAVGKSLPEGVRDGDPNDRIPRELRRDLRGAYPIFAWLDHVDLLPGNFLDMWVSDPGDRSRHYVKHYLIDFGMSFGVMGTELHDRRRTYDYRVDPGATLVSILSLGLDDRPWDNRSAPRLRGVSMLFDVDSFRPETWRSDFPYVPFQTSDRFDKFWGTKIIARFGRDQIRAAVEAGRFSDPRTVEYLTGVLMARQRLTEEAWFKQVNPIDHVAIQKDGLFCFSDLALGAELAQASTTTYEIATFDRAARPIAAPYTLPGVDTGDVCTAAVHLAKDATGYTIVRITTNRPGFHGSTLVHVGRDPATHAPRVIGLWRT